MNRIARLPCAQRLGSEETGSAMIVALWLLVIFGLGLAALLTYTEVSFRTGEVHRQARDRSYTTEGAVELGLARLAQGVCDPLQELTLNGISASVTCRAPNVPPWALLALGDDPGEDGVRVVPGSGDVEVRGDLLSASGIRNDGEGVLRVGGRARARGACQGRIEAAGRADDEPGLVCDDATLAVADPGYALPDTDDLPHRPAPTCPDGAWLVPLEPGFHSDGAALTALTDGSCAGRVIWLKPGLHYLNFTFVDPGPDAQTCAGEDAPCVWAVTDPTVAVVAGTPRGWSPTQPEAPALRMPGSCRRGGPGVRLVVGGATQLDFGEGRFELCPDPSFADPEVAVHGLAGVPRTAPRPTALAAGKVVGDGFDHPRRTLVIGEQPEPLVATAALSRAPGPARATLTFTDFGATSPLPSGARLDAALLHVAHHEAGDLAELRITVYPGGREPIVLTAEPGDCVQASFFCQGDEPHQDVIDLTRFGIERVGDLADLRIVYAVAVAEQQDAAAVAVVDGLALELRSTPQLLPTAAGGDGFDVPGHALAIGEEPEPLLATADLSRAAQRLRASLELDAFVATTDLPAGARLDAALLHVAHREQGELEALSITVERAAGPPVTLTARAGDCAAADFFCLGPDLHRDVIDLTAVGLVRLADLEGLRVTYTAVLADSADSATVVLDGVALEVHHTPGLTLAPGTAAADGFEDSEQAFAIGEEPEPRRAAARLSREDGRTEASLRLSGFGPVPDPGARLDAVLLHVAHHETAGLGGLTITLRRSGAEPLLLTGESGECAQASFLCLGEEPHQDIIDVSGYLFQGEHLRDLEITYQAVLDGAAVEASALLDGVALEVYLTPQVLPSGVAGDGFDAPEHALAIGEEPEPLVATALLSRGEGPTVATLTFTDFAAAASLPPGSRLDAALLRLAHSETGEVQRLDVDVRLAGGEVIELTALPAGECGEEGQERDRWCRSGEPRVDTVDLVPLGLDRIRKLEGLRIVYTAALGEDAASGTAVLDGLTLELHHTPPAFEDLSGCAAAQPFPAAGTCAFLRLGSADSVIHGTVYAPTGALMIDASPLAGPLLIRGAAVRHVTLHVPPTDQQAVITVPPRSTDTTLQLLVCVDAPEDDGGAGDGGAGGDGGARAETGRRPEALVRVQPPTKVVSWSRAPTAERCP